jgi:hypothetical protein
VAKALSDWREAYSRTNRMSSLVIHPIHAHRKAKGDNLFCLLHHQHFNGQVGGNDFKAKLLC